MSSKTFFYPLIALAAAIYPLLIYFGLNYTGPRVLALVLLVIMAVRLILLGNSANRQHVAQFILIAALCFFAALLDSDLLLRYYPVLMNFSFAALFWFSLNSEMPLIERFARLRRTTLQPHQIQYMRTLTKVWSVVLCINGVIAIYSVHWLSLKQWAFYNGFLAYFLLLSFGLAELAYRQFHKRKHRQLES